MEREDGGNVGERADVPKRQRETYERARERRGQDVALGREDTDSG